jgi:hypothetical protein
MEILNAKEGKTTYGDATANKNERHNMLNKEINASSPNPDIDKYLRDARSEISRRHRRH